VPVEATEAITPLVIWRKELRQDSGGAGRYRGGLGQVMEISSREDAAFGIFARFERVKYPARGRHGGSPGGAGRLSLASGVELKPKGLAVVPPGDRLVVEMPGGGGMGPAKERDRESVRRDVRLGYVSREAAVRDYGWKVYGVLEDAPSPGASRRPLPLRGEVRLAAQLNDTLCQFRFVQAQSEPRPLRQMEQPINRLRGVLEHRVRPR
jgi:N-methylhydantoinase B/oxoprolinase/acetone carboxylase alpha subunit